MIILYIYANKHITKHIIRTYLFYAMKQSTYLSNNNYTALTLIYIVKFYIFMIYLYYFIYYYYYDFIFLLFFIFYIHFIVYTISLLFYYHCMLLHSSISFMLVFPNYFIFILLFFFIHLDTIFFNLKSTLWV